MNYQELKKLADDSRKTGNFENALLHFESILHDFPAQSSCWDHWGYAYCLLKLKRLRDAENYARSYIGEENNFQPVKGILAWTIYYQYLKGAEAANETKAITFAEQIISLVKLSDPYAPYIQTVFCVTSLLEKKFPYPAAEIKKWISLLNPGLLKDEPYEFTGSNGEKTETASPREKYYMVQSKLLFEEGKYEECYKCCTEALQSLKAFHYKNNVWFTRRSALCLGKTGKSEECLQLLLEVHRKCKEWFVKAEIGELYLELGDTGKALVWLSEAALGAGEPEKKLKVYGLLATLYLTVEQQEEASLHTYLATALRIENGWKIDEISQVQLQEAGYNFCNGTASSILLKKLSPLWEKAVQEDKPRHRGKIKSLLPHGRAGFIQADTGDSYYFDLRQVRGVKDSIKPGIQVDFCLEDNFDPKRNKPVQNAVQIIATASQA